MSQGKFFLIISLYETHSNKLTLDSISKNERLLAYVRVFL